jgi:hypothetical protein
MTLLRVARLPGVLLFAMMILYAVPTFGQTADLAGEYANLNHEDAMERAGGPPLGDYMGIPLSEAGRIRAESNDEAIWGLPEFSCRPHPAPYQWRAAGGVQIRKEIDPVNRELTAFPINWQRSLDRIIYMDGRPHPDENAMHSWSGFSTGEFIGNILKVTTTHLKESYLKRNGVMFSDKAKMTEYIYRRGDYLTILMILEDPYYLTEPWVQTTNYRWAPNTQMEIFPCTVIDEGLANRQVPHFLPGANPYLLEFAKENGTPPEAAKGGSDTMYPDYRQKLKKSSNE